MKHLLIFGLLLLATIQVAAQRENADSLVNVLETQKLTAIEQMELYRKICDIYLYNDVEKLLLYAQKGLALAETGKNKSYISKFYDHIGRVYYFKKQFDLAHDYYSKGLKIAIEEKDLPQEAVTYLNLGSLYAMQRNYAAGLEYFLKALSYFETKDEKTKDDKKNCRNILYNISIIHNWLNNKERAIYYLEQAKEYADSMEDLMPIYYGLGNAYTGQPEKRLEYYQKAYEITLANGNKAFEAGCLENLSSVYKNMGDYDKAIEYSERLLELSKETGDNYALIGAYYTLSDVYRLQEKWKESEVAAGMAWEIDSADIDYANVILANLIIANINLSNKEKATALFSKFHEIVREERQNEDKLQESLAEMEVKYETEKKDMQIASLEKERQLYLWLGIAGVLLAVALGLVFWQYSWNMRKKRQIIASEAISEGELGERMRIAEDLHDRLGGSLSAVKMGLNNAESLQNISDKIDTCMSELRDIMNNIIPRSLRQYGMKGALEDLCTQYDNLQFHFFGDDMRIKHNLEYTVYCCARELVNNAQKHAGASTVNLQLVQSRKHVSLTVQDDGCGFDERTVVKGDGLQNIRNRIASCRGKIDIVSAPGKGTETVIELSIER